ncbi:uncharacterized protein FOKN1_1051 [Thiohalobacter thiocyanaticus]|uniref:DUF4398 domain-containing protein n=1 Tax=Thiohalobacter thiocyanaticus TaxID=585455 RepID=A0A1Z4VPB8_9GAMM|nr:uncharacterized protein FOKN1_1051 [Thiohalobacter thiocyanaticus]
MDEFVLKLRYLSGRCVHALPALLLLLLTGCATAPVQEMSDARQALLAAEEAGAVEYAGDTLANARAYLGRAEQALSAHDYERARVQAELARAAAREARELALERIERQSRE